MSYFRFKYFQLRQGFSALKFGTDAMVLGALAVENLPAVKKVLDVGSGTGAIALMLAQNFRSSQIDAIEIDEQAALEACFNFSQSPFHNQLNLFKGDFFHFDFKNQYQVIVSNPPYYQQTLLGKNERLNLAKHASSFSFAEFYKKCFDITTLDGILCLIIPSDDWELQKEAFQDKEWFCNRKISVYSKTSQIVRLVIFLEKVEHNQVNSEFVIRNQDNSYSTQYISLTKKFHFKEL